MDAILTAMQFLQFFELPKKDQPPRRLWTDVKGLKRWFDGVRADDPRLPEGSYEENDAAKGLIAHG